MAVPELFLISSLLFFSKGFAATSSWTDTYHTFVMSKRQSNIASTSARDLVKPAIQSIADNAGVYMSLVLKNVCIVFLARTENTHRANANLRRNRSMLQDISISMEIGCTFAYRLHKFWK